MIVIQLPHVNQMHSEFWNVNRFAINSNVQPIQFVLLPAIKDRANAYQATQEIQKTELAANLNEEVNAQQVLSA